MNLEELKALIKNKPDDLRFNDVIDVIDSHFTYTPARFSNGLAEHKIINEPGTNEGSCKIFAFAMKMGLNKEATLHCFGHYYRDDVLAHPHATDHANIRTFMQFGWEGIHFDTPALG
jgi:hypothetical protein